MEEEILKILKSIEQTSYTIIEINDILKLKTIEEYQNLEKTLSKLCEDGILYYSDKKKKYLLLENSHLIRGKLIMTSKGYGFVEKEDNTKDIYISEDNLNNAMDNDIVLVELINKSIDRPEGKIIKVIKKNYSQVVGVVYKKDDNYYVKKDKSKVDIYIPKEYLLGAVEGNKVLVRPLKENGNKGEITKILGHINDVGIDILSYVYEYEFHDKFNDVIELELKDIPLELNEDEISKGIKDGRIDLRDEIIFTIDGDDTKDIDDAISIKRKKNGSYELGVHIADVSYYVKEDSNLDKEAYFRSTSVYLVDRVVPMLPHKLSNGICSLNPNCDRFAFSCIMEVNNKGEVTDYKITPSIIKSRIQMTYNNVNQILENNITPKDYEPYKESLLIMMELSNILRKKMIKRGYIEFDSPEAKILVDKSCHPYDIKLREQKTGEKLIENFMILANETVASHLYYQSLPSIYRVHDKPNIEKVSEFLNFLSLRGYVITGKNKIQTSLDLQNIINQINESDNSKVLNDLAIRTQAKAIYSNINIGHFGLGSSCYAHFTSPIRRYSDLVLHRLLKDYNKNLNLRTIEKWELKLPMICEHTSKKEQDALNCERDVEKMKKAEYMQDHIGEEYTGVISGITNFGIFVELPNTIEGLVKFEDIKNDYFVCDKTGYMALSKKTNKRYLFGDSIKVKAINAEKERSIIDFELIDKEKNKTKVPRKLKKKKNKKEIQRLNKK